MTARTFGRVWITTIGAIALAYLALRAIVTVRWAGNFESFFVLALLGGIVLAGLRFALRDPGQDTIAVADPFARDLFSTDTVNMAHIRVAGVGGAGLVLAAMVVAFQYQLTAAVVVLGVAGGLIGAAARIVSRRFEHS